MRRLIGWYQGLSFWRQAVLFLLACYFGLALVETAYRQFYVRPHILKRYFEIYDIRGDLQRRHERPQFEYYYIGAALFPNCENVFPYGCFSWERYGNANTIIASAPRGSGYQFAVVTRACPQDRECTYLSRIDAYISQVQQNEMRQLDNLTDSKSDCHREGVFPYRIEYCRSILWSKDKKAKAGYGVHLAHPLWMRPMMSNWFHGEYSIGISFVTGEAHISGGWARIEDLEE